jgi:hypothetical protein
MTWEKASPTPVPHRYRCRGLHVAVHTDLGIVQWSTPGKYVYVVPKMTTELMLEAWGAGGGGGQFNHVKGGLGGGGGFVQTVIEVSGSSPRPSSLSSRLEFLSRKHGWQAES